jgi:hypothetical protein
MAGGQVRKRWHRLFGLGWALTMAKKVDIPSNGFDRSAGPWGRVFTVFGLQPFASKRWQLSFLMLGRRVYPPRPGACRGRVDWRVF